MEQPATNKIPTCVGLTPELRAKVDEAARTLDRSRSWITAAALQAWLKAHAEKGDV